MLTTAQLQSLKALIAADPVLNAIPKTPDGASSVKDALNLSASPDFIVWKSSETNEAIGDAMNGTEVAGLSALQMQRLQVASAYSGGTQNPSRADRRALFDAVFSGAGGNITRPALLVLWKRKATRAEKLYATGTGSDASPATITFEGALTYYDVLNAWAS